MEETHDGRLSREYVGPEDFWRYLYKAILPVCFKQFSKQVKGLSQGERYSLD